jgi:hypothetical protein
LVFRGNARLWMVMLIPLWVQFASDPRLARLVVPVVGSVFAAAELAVKTVVTDETVTTSQFGRTLRTVQVADVAAVDLGRGARQSRFWSSGPPLQVQLNDGRSVLFPWLRGRADVAKAIVAKLVPDA